MDKKKLLVPTLIVLFLGAPQVATAKSAEEGVPGAGANDKVFGAGVILGEPTGGTLKVFFNQLVALQFSTGILFFNRDSFLAVIDIVWHPSIIHESHVGILIWYLGVGPGFGIMVPWHKNRNNDWEPDFAFWVRVPGGVSYLFEKVPVEVFLEISPASRFYPFWDFDFFASTGARWYF